MALSTGEIICEDFNRHLKEMEMQGRCIFLPFEVKSMNLKGIGKFVEKNIEFSSMFNIIYGRIGTGKTTVVSSFAGISGPQRLLKSEQNNGEINVTTSDGRRHHLDVYGSGDVRCVVLDSGYERLLDNRRYNDFLNYLYGLHVQLILVIENMDDELKESINRIFPNCKFIQLN